MGILTMMEDPETGLEKLVYIPEDEDGLPDLENMVTLGKTIEKSLDKIDVKIAEIIDKAVKEKILKEYRHVNRQAELKNTVLAEIKQVIAKNGAFSEISKKFNLAFKSIKDMFERINDM